MCKLQELNSKLTDEEAKRILHPEDKSGFQGLAENLSRCYHFFLHGALGKLKDQQIINRELNKWTQRGPGYAPTEASKSEWRVGMKIEVWVSDQKKNDFDLAKLEHHDASGRSTECDPMAARLQVSAQSVFRMKCKIPASHLSNDLQDQKIADRTVDVDIMLSYLPVTYNNGELWQKFFEASESGKAPNRPFGAKACSVFWEGRGLLPAKPFNLDITALLAEEKSGVDGITRRQAARVIADVFVSRPIHGGVTKQISTDDIGRLVNLALNTEEVGWKEMSQEGKPELFFPTDRSVKAQKIGGTSSKLSPSIVKWVKECATQDESIIGTFGANATTAEVSFPSCILSWEAKEGSGEKPPVRLRFCDAHAVQCLMEGKRGCDTSPELSLDGCDAAMVKVTKSGASTIKSTIMLERMWRVHETTDHPLLVKKGTIVAFLHPGSGKRDLGKGDWKDLYIGSVRDIQNDYDWSKIPQHQTAPGKKCVLTSVYFNIEVFPAGSRSTTVEVIPVSIDSAAICFTKPTDDSTPYHRKQWERLERKCQDRRLVLHVLHPFQDQSASPGVHFFAGLHTYARREESQQAAVHDLGIQEAGWKIPKFECGVVPHAKTRDCTVFNTTDVGKKLAVSEFPPPGPAHGQKVVIRQTIEQSDFENWTATRHTKEELSPAGVKTTQWGEVALKTAWDQYELTVNHVLVPEVVSYTLEAILGNGSTHPFIRPLLMKVQLYPSAPAKCELAQSSDMKIFPIGDEVQFELSITDAFDNVIDVDTTTPPTITRADNAEGESLDGLQCACDTLAKLKPENNRSWGFSKVVFDYDPGSRPDVTVTKKPPEEIKLNVRFHYKQNRESKQMTLPVTLKTCAGSPHHLMPTWKDDAVKVCNFENDKRYHLKVKCVDKYGWKPFTQQDEEYVFKYRVGGPFRAATDAADADGEPQEMTFQHESINSTMKIKFVAKIEECAEPQDKDLVFTSRSDDNFETDPIENNIRIKVQPNPKRIASCTLVQYNVETGATSALLNVGGDDKTFAMEMKACNVEDSPELRLKITGEDGKEFFPGDTIKKNPTLINLNHRDDHLHDDGWEVQSSFTIDSSCTEICTENKDGHKFHVCTVCVYCPVTGQPWKLTVHLKVTPGDPAKWHIKDDVWLAHPFVKCGDLFDITVQAKDKFGNFVR